MINNNTPMMDPTPETALVDATPPLDPAKEKPEEHSALNQLQENQNNLETIHENLANLVDSLNSNRSMVTRVAQYWGNFSTAKKVMLGFLTATPAAMGVFGHVIIFCAVGGITLMLYTASGMVLNDHHRANQNADKIKSNVLHISNILTCIIEAMRPISQALAKSAMDYKIENSNFVKSNKNLKKEIKLLNEQVRKIQECNDDLNLLKDDLVLQQKHSQEQLQEKIHEFDKLHAEMADKLEKATVVTEVLQGTVVNVSKALISDIEDQNKFKDRLSSFVNDKEKSFLEISNAVTKAQADLQLTTEKLNRVTAEYEMLLQRNAEQVSELSRQVSELKQLRQANPDLRLNSVSIFKQRDNQNSFFNPGASFLNESTFCPTTRRNSCQF